MLKTILLASSMTVAVPALAQDIPQSTPQSTTTAPAQSEPQSQSTDTAQAQSTPQGAPIAGAPVTEATPAQQAQAPADPAATSAPAESAAATPDAAAQPAGATQVADVVSTEFPTYDKNSDKSLDKAEFGAWMVALKSASDPSTKASDPATKKWVDGAFASADTDKSKSVTQSELTDYLSQAAG